MREAPARYVSRDTHHVIGVLAAHPIELRPLAQRLRARRCSRGGWSGAVEGTPVVLGVTGQGGDRAAAAAERFLAETACEWLVVTGFAGATQPSMAVGAMVIPEAVADLRAGRSGTRYRASSVASELQVWAGALGGVMATVDRVVTDPAGKARFGREAGVVAVDLESAAIAAVAERRRVPWLVVRVILDPLERPLGVVSAAHAARLAISVAGWPRLWRFAEDLGTASAALRERVGNVVTRIGTERQQRTMSHDERIVVSTR